MNKIAKLIVTILGGLIVLTVSFGIRSELIYDKAKVIKVDRIYEIVKISYPEKRCWNEQVTRGVPRHRSNAGTIVGGLVGGVLGYRAARGRGQRVATFAGSLLGASIGHKLTHTQYARAYTTRERHCEVVDRYETEEQLIGYRVKYKYKGSTYVTRTEIHPGKWIRLPEELPIVGRAASPKKTN